LYACRRNGREVNADANAALNIARGMRYKVKVTRRMESYIVTHSGVKPLNSRRRDTLDPEV
jgi:transposase